MYTTLLRNLQFVYEFQSSCTKASIDANGEPLTDKALAAANAADAVLLGAIGGPVSSLISATSNQPFPNLTLP